MILADEFERQGVKLEFVTEEMGDSPEDRMFFNMRGLIAEYEREKIKERTIRGSREKTRQGRLVNPGSVPYGYRYDAQKQTLEEDPEKSRMLRLIFLLYANEDISIRALAGKLTGMAIPSPSGNGRWSPSTLDSLLRNEVYIGRLHQFKTRHVEPKKRRDTHPRHKKSSTTLRPREEWITTGVPPLVTKDAFEKVRRKLEKNAALSKRNTRRQYLLSGLLFCGVCRDRMTGHAMHEVPYYRCRRKASRDKYLPGSKPCFNPEIKTELVDGEVWNTIRELIQDPDALINRLKEHNQVHSTSREMLEQELSIIHNRLKAIPSERNRLVEGYRKGFYSDEVMQEQMLAIDKDQSALEDRIRELEKQLRLKTMTAKQEENVKRMMEKMNAGLDNLDFSGR